MDKTESSNAQALEATMSPAALQSALAVLANAALAQQGQNGFQQIQTGKRDALEFFAKYPDQMTIDNLCDANVPCYLQNQTNGRVAIDFEINGKVRTITVATGWLPLCLNDRMSPNDIRSSGSLRDHLTKGSVILMHPTAALELVNSPLDKPDVRMYL